MSYRFPVPRHRGLTKASQIITDHQTSVGINNIILHALVVRISFNDGHTEEFYTKLHDDNTIEIDIPEDRLNMLDNIEVGPKIRQFIDWLTSKSELIPNTITVINDLELVPVSTITTVLVDASNNNVSITLPVPSPTHIINVKRIDKTKHAVVVLPNTGTIDGQSELRINQQYESFQIAADSNNYYIT